MKKLLTFFTFTLLSFFSLFAASGHFTTNSLGYTPSGYTGTPNYIQDAVTKTGADSDINANHSADAYVRFEFNTSGKSVFLVYTTNGTNPSKTNGSSIPAAYNYNDGVGSFFLANIPAAAQGTTVKYIFYISDSDLPSAWGRVAADGYIPGGWTEGNSTFSYVTSMALPIELTKFTAKAENNQVNVIWETASEANNNRFEIERSASASNWGTIATQKSQNADSNQPLSYTFVDEKPLSGVSYYRLRQVDLDGSVSLSKVVKVQMGKIATAVDVFPNPVQGDLVNLAFHADKSDSNIRIFDAQGRLVRQINTEVQAGQKMPLDLSGLPTGMLYLQVDHNTITPLVRY